MKSRNDRINEAAQDAKISEAALVERQRIKRALGPNLWSALLEYCKCPMNTVSIPQAG